MNRITILEIPLENPALNTVQFYSVDMQYPYNQPQRLLVLNQPLPPAYQFHPFENIPQRPVPVTWMQEVAPTATVHHYAPGHFTGPAHNAPYAAQYQPFLQEAVPVQRGYAQRQGYEYHAASERPFGRYNFEPFATQPVAHGQPPMTRRFPQPQDNPPQGRSGRPVAQTAFPRPAQIRPVLRNPPTAPSGNTQPQAPAVSNDAVNNEVPPEPTADDSVQEENPHDEGPERPPGQSSESSETNIQSPQSNVESVAQDGGLNSPPQGGGRTARVTFNEPPESSERDREDAAAIRGRILDSIEAMRQRFCATPFVPTCHPDDVFDFYHTLSTEHSSSVQTNRRAPFMWNTTRTPARQDTSNYYQRPGQYYEVPEAGMSYANPGPVDLGFGVEDRAQNYAYTRPVPACPTNNAANQWGAAPPPFRSFMFPESGSTAFSGRPSGMNQNAGVRQTPVHPYYVRATTRELLRRSGFGSREYMFDHNPQGVSTRRANQPFMTQRTIWPVDNTAAPVPPPTPNPLLPGTDTRTYSVPLYPPIIPVTPYHYDRNSAIFLPPSNTPAQTPFPGTGHPMFPGHPTGTDQNVGSRQRPVHLYDGNTSAQPRFPRSGDTVFTTHPTGMDQNSAARQRPEDTDDANTPAQSRFPRTANSVSTGHPTGMDQNAGARQRPEDTDDANTPAQPRFSRTGSTGHPTGTAQNAGARQRPEDPDDAPACSASERSIVPMYIDMGDDMAVHLEDFLTCVRRRIALYEASRNRTPEASVQNRAETEDDNESDEEFFELDPNEASLIARLKELRRTDKKRKPEHQNDGPVEDQRASKGRRTLSQNDRAGSTMDRPLTDRREAVEVDRSRVRRRTTERRPPIPLGWRSQSTEATNPGAGTMSPQANPGQTIRNQEERQADNAGTARHAPEGSAELDADEYVVVFHPE